MVGGGEGKGEDTIFFLFRPSVRHVLVLAGASNKHCLLAISCLFVLRFCCPVNPVWSCRAWSVYLTILLLGRLSPLSG